MQFAECRQGEWRIYAGALEAPQGDGYTAALVVRQERVGEMTSTVSFRDDSLSCGHRWPTADAALAYAIGRGRDFIRKRCGVVAAA